MPRHPRNWPIQNCSISKANDFDLIREGLDIPGFPTKLDVGTAIKFNLKFPRCSLAKAVDLEAVAFSVSVSDVERLW